MSKYITDLQVSLTLPDENELADSDFIKINDNLNQGTKGNCIFLWYKEGQCGPITRIQFSFSDEMSQSLSDAGYTKINKNLNAGTGGDDIYLWFYKGSTVNDFPIKELQVTVDAANEAKQFSRGWERLACDLNRNTEANSIYLWVKRVKPTFISDVTATDGFQKDADNFQKGYIRVDEDTNRGTQGHRVFIWYRLTSDAKQGLTDLKISTSVDEQERFENQHYKQVAVDLNEKAGGNPVYLWYKKDDSSPPIKAVSVITNPNAVGPFRSAGVQVSKENLNSGNNGVTEHLCFYG